MPTFQNLRRGKGLIKAIPGMKIGTDGNGYKRNYRQGSKPFRSVNFSTYNATVSGVTRNSTGVALGNCVVQLFRTVDDLILYEITSDGSGNFIFYPSVSGTFYIVAYKQGSPDVFGTTVNTLVAV
jgi:hypothetical protein